MPKATKKKKEKAADFSKAKLKLGKGKKVPSNVIDTSFKARSIALPSQSIATEKDDSAPTTKRRLTFDDLVGHLRHYNASTRRDSINGLRELFEAHPEMVEDNLAALFNACVRLIGDEDASVRKGLLAFFAWILPVISAETLQPHAALLLLFTTSAQTHIFPEIRVDAIRFLDLYLEVFPEVVVHGWQELGKAQKQEHGSRVLEGYLGLLSAGTTFGEGGDTGPARATSTASVVLSPVSKLVVIKSLSTFLRAATATATTNYIDPSRHGSSSSSIPTWYLQSSFLTTEGFKSFDQLLHSASSSPSGPVSLRTWVMNPDEDISDERAIDGFYFARKAVSSHWTIQDLSSVIDEVLGANLEGLTGDRPLLVRLARTLYATLLSTILDCAPAVFSPSGAPPETELKLIIATTEIVRCLYGTLLQDSEGNDASLQPSRSELDQLLRKLTPYFPFTIGGGRRDVKIEQAFQDLNVTFCELTSLLLLSSSKSPAISQAPLPQLPRVIKFVVNLLRGEAPGSSLSRPISAQAYIALLPSLWSLLQIGPDIDTDDRKQQSILGVIVEQALRTSSTSTVKRATIEFVGRLALLETDLQYRGAFRVSRDASDQDAKALGEWVVQLPKTLWEISANDGEASEIILRLILRLIQHQARCINAEIISSLRSRLAPFFTISHTTRGELPGPFAKLTSKHLRKLALDVAATLLVVLPSTPDLLDSAVSKRVNNNDEATYWSNIKTALMGKPPV